MGKPERTNGGKMTESNTRKWWRTRIKAIVDDPYDVEGRYFKGRYGAEAIEAWLDDLMQTPELSMVEWAEQNGGKLAVVVSAATPVCVSWSSGPLTVEYEEAFRAGFETAIKAMVDDGWRKVVRQ
jgi:hypothetical protein